MKIQSKAVKRLMVYPIAFVFLLGALPSLCQDENIEKIIQKVYPSVVKVEARNDFRKVATGVVIDNDGHIVTTALVTPREESFFIIDSKGKRVEAEFLGMDPVTHVALVKAKDLKWTPIEWGDAKDIGPGTWIGIVGISPEEKPCITQGIISSVGTDSLRLNAVVVPGSSGSPVVDKRGRMIGLVRGAYSEVMVVRLRGQEIFGGEEALTSSLAAAIPAPIVHKIAREIREKGNVERGWLGVYIRENEDGEVEIAEVEKGSPADLAHLREEDIILEFDGIEITSGKMLAHEIRMRRPGDTVTIVIKRDGEKQNITVKLGEYSRLSILSEFESKFPRLFPPKSYEIPKRRVIPFSPQPRSQRFYGRKYIGIYIDELNPELAEYFGVKGDAGLLIKRLTKDGPAEKADLRVGDVIVKADGKRVGSLDKLTRIIQDKEKGEEIRLEIIREKKSMEIKVKVDAEEDESRPFFSNAWQGFSGTWYRCIKV